MADNGRLRYLDYITKQFLENGTQGKAESCCDNCFPLPTEEEKELKGTFQAIIGHGKKIMIQQRIDSSVLGEIVVDFGQKVFDMSIRTTASK